MAGALMIGVLVLGWASAGSAAEAPPSGSAPSPPDTPTTTSTARGTTATDGDSAIVFPTVQGSNLEGKEYVLPRDLEGRYNLLFVAFLREQQEMIDTWMPAARYLRNTYPELRHYELPTIKPLNAMTRWFINKGMRGGIPDPEARAATITLYTEKEPFRQTLGIESEETITILLVDQNGLVIWRTVGPRTDAKTQELNQAVHRALHRPDAPSAGQAR